MKFIQKHNISIIVFILLTLFVYKIWQDVDIAQQEELKVITEMKNNTGNLADKIPAASDTDFKWGANPFGKGEPVLEEAPHKTPFQKPNTEWKTRTLSGITYVFGEGNPKEVALDEKGIQEMADTCLDMPPSIDIEPTNKRAAMLWKNGFCNSENARPRYLSKQVEYHLLMALGSSEWQDLYSKCEVNIRYGDLRRSGSSDPFLTFDQVFASGFLDMDHFIQVDPETGWKQISLPLVWKLMDFIWSARLYSDRHELLDNPYGDCVDIYSEDIMDHLSQAIQIYGLPLGSIQSDFYL